MSYNTANLTLANEEIYHDLNLYFVTSLENRENPESVPQGWNILLIDQISFELAVSQAYGIFNATEAVYDENGVPQYLIGEFAE